MSASGKHATSLLVGFLLSLGFYFVARANGYDIVASTAFALLVAIVFLLLGIYFVVTTSRKH